MLVSWWQRAVLHRDSYSLFVRSLSVLTVRRSLSWPASCSGALWYSRGVANLSILKHFDPGSYDRVLLI